MPTPPLVTEHWSLLSVKGYHKKLLVLGDLVPVLRYGDDSRTRAPPKVDVWHIASRIAAAASGIGLPLNLWRAVVRLVRRDSSRRSLTEAIMLERAIYLSLTRSGVTFPSPPDFSSLVKATFSRSRVAIFSVNSLCFFSNSALLASSSSSVHM